MHTTFSQPGATYPFGAHVAVVEVDVGVGQGRPASGWWPWTTPA